MPTKLDEAIVYAAILHEGQRRKYGLKLPYIFHLFDVLETLLKHVPDADEDMQVAAILHDTVEDTDATIEHIESRFGPGVASLVFDLTTQEVEGVPRAVRKDGEAERLGNVSAKAQTIKLADMISNTRDIVKHNPGFARVYLREKARLLEKLTKADPEMRVAAQRSLTRSLSRLNLHDLENESV